jgi:hypothetical protein
VHLLTACTSMTQATSSMRLGPDALADPKFNVAAMARLTATLAPNTTGRTHYSGRAFGVLGDGRTIPLYGIEGMGSLRALPQESGAIRFLFSEFAVYTDLTTGEPLTSWRNPVTGETVPVWHQRNGPINYEIDPAKPSFGMFTRTANNKPGFLLPWSVADGVGSFVIDTVSERKNPLDPEVWVKESSGKTIHLSEHGQYFVAMDDLLNPDLVSLSFRAALQSLKPWHPWMMMGQTPGKVFAVLTARKITGLDDLPPSVARFAKAELGAFLEAPPTWTGAYVTANQLYMREKKPMGAK